MHDRLQQLPQVEEVQVVRNLPAEIDIQITERKPIAWITSDKEMGDPFGSDAAFLVDARGALMKEKKLLPEYLGFPVIVGCTNESLEAGNTLSSFEAKAALELLRLSTRSFMQTRFQVREIDISKGYCLLVTDKNHSARDLRIRRPRDAVATPRAAPGSLRRFAARDRDGQLARATEHSGNVYENARGGDQ